MPLAFRSRPIPPNNRSLAVKRLSHLRTFLEYKEHYSQFAEGMLKDGHAELAAEMAKSGEAAIFKMYMMSLLRGRWPNLDEISELDSE